MNRVSKVILVTLVSALLLTIGVLLALNLYLQSPGTQARIQAELSRALRLPLVITNTSVTLWNGLRINGLTVPAENGNFLEASSFSARYRLFPLLRKRLVIYEMRIENPKVVWTQNAEGKWALPTLAKAPLQAAEGKEEKPEKPKPATRSERDFQVLLDGFKVRNASVEFVDSNHVRVALFTDVNMDYTLLTAERVQGTGTVGRLVYANWLIFSNVRSGFEYARGELTLPALEAELGGGSVRGTFQFAPQKEKSPFVATLSAEELDGARIATEAGWPPGQVSGSMSGTLEVSGSSREFARLEGKGHLTASNGQFRQLELLQTIGQVLEIEELANLHLKKGSMDFHLADEKVFVDSLTLESPDLRITAQGYTRFDGKLVLDAQLALDTRDVARTPKLVRNLFKSSEKEGESAIEFKVYGKIDKPKTDLAEKVIGKTIGDQFESFVSGLFGTKKRKEEKSKEEKKKKKDAENSPAAPVLPPPASPLPGDAPAPSPAGRPVPGRTSPGAEPPPVGRLEPRQDRALPA